MKPGSFMFGGSTPWAVKPPPGLVVVSYGGGVNTVALLVLLRDLGVAPKAIVMADPGSEWPETLAYRDRVARPWLASIGFPDVEVIERRTEVKTERPETLAEECFRIQSIPSIAFGFKRCSLKFKRDPQLRWVARQPWAVAEWDAGRKLVKAIGYDAGEPGRILPAFGDAWEHARAVPWYPVHEAGRDRDGCIDMIRAASDLCEIAARAGIDPIPPKSACTFCPSNTVDDWQRLRDTHPPLFAEALDMEDRAQATIENPESFGLMRPRPVGRKQLRVWAAGGYDMPAYVQRNVDALPMDDALPCECAL